MTTQKLLRSALFSQRGEKHTALKWLNTALFDLNSPLGRTFNILGMLIIVASVTLSMVSTLAFITDRQREIIEGIELAVTLIFTVEYFLRLLAAYQPRRYAFSIYGMIDLLTWLPLLFFGDTNLAIRLLRLLRLLKLIRYLRAMNLFLSSLHDIIDSLIVVICAIVIIILFSGNLIHTVEPDTFPDAFLGSWWALVTMTTVGYGDIVPLTGAGKLIAACLMLSGITMFAMLTATISVKIAGVLNTDTEGEEQNAPTSSPYLYSDNYCPNCGLRQGESITPHCHSCMEPVRVNDKYCAACGKQQTLELR